MEVVSCQEQYFGSKSLTDIASRHVLGVYAMQNYGSATPQNKSMVVQECRTGKCLSDSATLFYAYQIKWKC